MNRFRPFSSAELAILWAALEKQQRFWDENPDCLPVGGCSYLSSLTSELHQAWLENHNLLPAKSDRQSE